MNILQINTLDKKGGAAKIAYSLKEELEHRGHETSMFVGKKYSNDENVYSLNNSSKFINRVKRKLSYWLANDTDFFSSDHILKTREFKKADIIHCHNLHTYYFNLSTLKKISRLKPIIWTFHDMWPITAHCAHSFDGKLKDTGFFTCPSLNIYPPIAWHNEKYLEKRKRSVYEKVNLHIVTPSKWLADKVGQSVLKNKSISVIYNGINTSIFKPHDKQECRRLLDLPPNKQIILVVAKKGQLNSWKGGNYAQEVIKTFMGDSRVFFVDLGGSTNQTNNRVKTVSYVEDRIALAKYYSAADMLLYPSIADNCPLVVLEAMACGLPVISFKTGGIPELIEHKVSGYIAEYENTDDLQTGIKYLLNLPLHEIEKMKYNSSDKIKTSFTLELMADNYLKLYTQILNSN